VPTALERDQDEGVVSFDELAASLSLHHPDASLDLLKKAYAFSEEAHKNQKRASGSPYFVHPSHVAKILASLRLDLSTVLTGLLHDTVEDTHVSLQDIEKHFGPEVRELVDGVTKLSKLEFKSNEEKQAENFRKMLLAMGKDIRVILVKLADRVHNMRTLAYLDVYKQTLIARETLDIYAPLANRLGMGEVKIELEDLSLRFLHPDVFYRLVAQVKHSQLEREKYIFDVCEILRQLLEDAGVRAEVLGRAKHFYSIYVKMERRKVTFDQVYDLIAFRMIVPDVSACYQGLGLIHAAFKPVPGRFKDYIAIPKVNNYQSLHTTVIGPSGERVEVQLRTEEMHRVAENGIAAHWKYKEGRFDVRSKERMAWVSQLLEWQRDVSDPAEFLQTVKIDLFEEDVFVFTPKGAVKQLPFGATPIDFAYCVHTDVGHHCVGAKVNGKMVPLKYRLKSGDTVQILTSETQAPSKDWLKIVKSSRAKAKIRSVIQAKERLRAQGLGRELLEKHLKHQGLLWPKQITWGPLKLLEKSGLGSQYKTFEELFIHLGFGRVALDHVSAKLGPHLQSDGKSSPRAPLIERVLGVMRRSPAKGQSAISVGHVDDVLIRLAKCCNPLPGDPITGFITRGRGVTVHLSACSRILENEQDRKVEVEWNAEVKGDIQHTAKIKVLGQDIPGLLAQLSQAVTALRLNISGAHVRTTKDRKAVFLFDVQVTDAKQLPVLMATLEGQQGVISVERHRG
jgi:GTP diphosphokinase / guanosine-3',5'-bis(diphosphate) 3'-diphosphatase